MQILLDLRNHINNQFKINTIKCKLDNKNNTYQKLRCNEPLPRHKRQTEKSGYDHALKT